MARPTRPPRPLVTVAEVLATRVREARQARGWSQRDLARYLAKMQSPLGYRGTVGKVETGDRAVRAAELLDLAAALLVPPAELLVPSDDDQRVQSPWGVLTARELRLLVDPAGTYIKAAGWGGQYALGVGHGQIMADRGELEDEPHEHPIMTGGGQDPTDLTRALRRPGDETKGKR